MNPTCTQLGPDVDKQIYEMLMRSVGIILEDIPETISVVLYGGFGRGEGSVRIIKDRVFPANDFDLYIIVKSKIAPARLDATAQRAAQLGVLVGGMDNWIVDAFCARLAGFPHKDLPFLQYAVGQGVLKQADLDAIERDVPDGAPLRARWQTVNDAFANAYANFSFLKIV